MWGKTSAPWETKKCSMCDTKYELYSLGLHMFSKGFILIKDSYTSVHHSNSFTTHYPPPLCLWHHFCLFLEALAWVKHAFLLTMLGYSVLLLENSRIREWLHLEGLTALVPSAMFFSQYFSPRKSMGIWEGFFFLLLFFGFFFCMPELF